MREEAGEGGFPSLLSAALKFLGFAIGVSLAGWLIYRIFRFRRLLGGVEEVEETRESVFSWGRVNDDLASLANKLLGNLAGLGRRTPRGPTPRNPREFYHAMLSLAARRGRPRRDWQTPREHEGGLEGALPQAPVGRIVEDFQAAYYGASEAPEEELAQLRQDWTALNEYVEEQERRESEEAARAPEG